MSRGNCREGIKTYPLEGEMSVERFSAHFWCFYQIINMTTTTTDWYLANYQYLMASVNRVQRHLELYIKNKQNQPHPTEEETDSSFPSSSNLTIPFALDILCSQFNLSEFERNILLMCVGIELDPNFHTLITQATDSSPQNYPRLSLALAALPQSNLRILSRQSPLQYWQLIEISPAITLTQSPLKIDPYILCYLLRESDIDPQLIDKVKPVQADLTGDLALPPSHQEIAQKVAKRWTESNSDKPLEIIELSQSDLTSKRRIAAEISNLFGSSLYRLSVSVLPHTSSELHQMKRRWERHAILTNSILLLECDNLNFADAPTLSLTSELISEIHTPIIISTQQRLPIAEPPLITFDVPQLSNQEKQTLWRIYLGETAQQLNGEVDRLVVQFNLNQMEIKSVCTQTLNQLHSAVSKFEGSDFSEEEIRLLIDNTKHDPTEIVKTLWNNCRIQSRPRLDTFAQRIETKINRSDLIFPERQMTLINQIIIHTRQEAKVYGDWGFQELGERGKAIIALFYGQSGTGKTTVAEIIAKENHLDLYRVDMSRVESKYIGETEKNLAQVFDAAEAGGVVLLFDEADAIFGKRGEVKEARDRYANQGVSYLLTRLETYRGLVILTTNWKDSIDDAFERRMRFLVDFPFPTPQERELIWRRAFPKETPTKGLNFRKLAQLAISGGVIRNIALGAAFLAADAGEAVEMKHLFDAAVTELAKMRQKPLGNINEWIAEPKSKR